jgi:hypothetical protein
MFDVTAMEMRFAVKRFLSQDRFKNLKPTRSDSGMSRRDLGVFCEEFIDEKRMREFDI